MEEFVNRWLVVVRNDCPEEYKTEEEAYKRQKELADKGFSSQVYHERHVLIKEPKRWVYGRERETNG